MTFLHLPVLVAETIRHLVTREAGVYIDGTLGGGGHAEAILKCLGNRGRVLGIDRDHEALEGARQRLQPYGERCLFLHGSYQDLDEAVRLLGCRQVDGILLDLGISSFQVDRPGRGFSFSKEGPLDMRMDDTDRTTAEEVIAESTRAELERILRDYGEERFAKRIAGAIVAARDRGRIRTTTALADIVRHAVPRRAWPRHIHPATRTFQALRIAVNRELERLDHFLGKFPSYLSTGGRLAVIAYHSLEDRRVKQSIRQWEREGVVRRVTKKALFPSEAEIAENPRARSARLRVAEKIA